MKIPATKSYSPSDCFKGKNIYYRDSDIDNWLPKEMPAIPEGDTKMFVTKSEQTFKQMFKDFTGSEEIKDEHIFSLKQIEAILEEPEKYELQTNGYANFFPISKEYMLCAYRDDDGQWPAFVDRLDRDRRWYADRRLLLRNFSLGTLDTLPLILIINGVTYKRQ